MNDPYRILGVSPNATDEEIKKAYRDLARKYHPDKYTNSDLADLASEKMKEVNSAYEQIQNMRKNGTNGSYGANGSYGSYGSYGGDRQGSGTNPIFAEIRRCINADNIDMAEQKLNEVHQGDRGAEWNYLYGCVMIKRGRYVDAQYYIDRACSMAPGNQEYRAAREQLHRRGGAYGGAYNSSPVADGCASPCNICAKLVLCDCCCECMGGDLIRCC